MIFYKFAVVVFFGVLSLTSTVNLGKVQAQECKANDKIFGFLVDKLPTAFGLNTCVANNLGTIAKAVASTLFSSCSVLDIYDLVKNNDLKGLFNLFNSIAAKPDEISPLIYKYMANQNDDRVDNLCDAFSGALGPCGEKVLPRLIPELIKDSACCAQISDVLELFNIIVPADKNIDYFIVNELINGFNSFLCSKRGKSSCGLEMFWQLTQKYTIENFDFFQHVVFPFITIGKGQECSGLSGKPFTDTASNAETTIMNHGCCVHQMRPFIQTIQDAIKYITGSNTWDIVGGMVSLKFPEGKFVNTIAGTFSCQFEDRCKNPKGMSNDVTKHRDPGSKNPGKNDLINTNCKMVDKCNAAKTVCSQVCEKGSVVVPDWLQSTLAYQRNLAIRGSFCLTHLPASHNSAITLANGFGNRDQLFNRNLSPDKWWSYLKTNNQMLSLTDQLNVGIRFLEIDTHYFLNQLRTAHCGSLGSETVAGIFRTLSKTIGNYGTYNWGPELLGCFPSISGIRASEQPSTFNTLKEIREWLDANPSEFVIVYLDTGADIKRSDKFGAIDSILTEVFGELIVPLTELDALATNQWEGVAYNMYELCGAAKDLTVDFIDTMPDAKRQINGMDIYSKHNWIRTWSDQLRYISMAASGILTRNFPVFLDADSIPKYLRWDINLISLDNVDVAKMEAHVWSWAENEPSTTEHGANVFINGNGRWVASLTAKKESRACWNSKNLTWDLVSFAEHCPPGKVYKAPTDPYQNYLLFEAIKAKNLGEMSVVINAALVSLGSLSIVPSMVEVTSNTTTPEPWLSVSSKDIMQNEN
ncbi:hypothetical protein F443_09701 [Plasmopara halstedii]|uniref:RxLR-like protein n=1 Tax=Plasmopara halstedii TaxID=4781 RepID=A0A0P1ARU6_PLAHL|nr:hypothetical protein F443_09701 [Plasmopara halstedii]CEG44169.1 hypothetical protein F443_09701 [Plasmopara halstedii]|eukprot:XP_024580538.1 hypothetical protein F443_09701 [Plasmopara halstedii]